MGMLAASSGCGRDGRRCRVGGGGQWAAPESLQLLPAIAWRLGEPGRHCSVAAALSSDSMLRGVATARLKLFVWVEDPCTLWKVLRGLMHILYNCAAATQRQCSRHGSSWPKLTRAQARCCTQLSSIIQSSRQIFASFCCSPGDIVISDVDCTAAENEARTLLTDGDVGPCAI